MGCIEGYVFRVINPILGGYKKWQFLQEEFQKQEEIRDVIISGRYLLPQSKNALSAVSTRDLTDFALLVAITMAVR